MSDVDFTEIMAALPKTTRNRFRKASEISLDRLPLASVGLTRALAGGIGYGRQTLMWGNKSSGKTSLLFQTFAAAQREGKTCGFIDVEGTFDPSWARRLGVDTDNLYISQDKLARDVADSAKDLVIAGIDIVGIDSISGIVPMSWVEDDELKGMDGTKQIGSKSRDIGAMINMVNAVNDHTAFILISQMRNKIGKYGAFGQHDGGNAAQFFSTTIIKLTSSAADRDQYKGNVFEGDQVFELPIGRPVNWTVEFNKIGPPSRSGTYDFYYDGEEIGVDVTAEVLDLAVLYGVIEKKGAWYYIDEQGYQGKAKAVTAIKAEPALQERLVKEILG